MRSAAQIPLLFLLLQWETAQAAELSSAVCRKGQGRGESKHWARSKIAGREVGAVGVMITQHQHFQHFLSAAPAIRFGCVDLPRSSCNSLIIQHYLLPD